MTANHVLQQGTFCGETIRHSVVAGLRLTESTYQPGLRIAKHRHELPFFSFVVRGDYSETCGTQTRSCTPRTLVFHPSGETHGDRFLSRGGQVLSLEIPTSWLERVRQADVAVERPVVCHGAHLSRLAGALYREFRYGDVESRLSIEGLALELLAAACRTSRMHHSNVPPVWLAGARERIGALVSNRLTLAMIASEAGVHPVHLARSFRRFYGLTVGEYIRDMRVSLACSLMSQSACSLADVALRAGFSSQSHFTTAFRHRTSLTPAQYRKAARG